MFEPRTEPHRFHPHKMPHYWYISAVVNMLKLLDAAPSGWRLFDAGPGHTATLSAVMSWDHTFSPALYPYGLAVLWERTDGWEHAAMNGDGSNQIPQRLPVPLWAKPADVAAACLALLEGEPPVATTREWDNAFVPAAVDRWQP